ncbi:MAG: hypothetical protein HYR85_21365 [Planctomycetes bacterium]|nr:hypothetical protein [Planctomycetota bacterium]MBI3843494.1 hypothetical protein [Planctomycetota bacterium]
MAAKGWWIGCGVLVVIALVVVGIGVGFVVSRARDVAHGLEQAGDRYQALNREFPFVVPTDGRITEDEFARYLDARRAIQATLAGEPGQENRGFLEGLRFLSSLPDQVSRVHEEALRRASLSLDQYRWVSRQIYTVIAEEINRPDGDPSIVKLREAFEQHGRRSERPAFGLQMSTSRNDPFGGALLDLSWLRVPEETRALVRSHAGDLSETPDVFWVDTFLLAVDFAETKSTPSERR